MPGYVCHAIMGNILSEELTSELEHRFLLDPKKLAVYSMAPDLILDSPAIYGKMTYKEKEEQLILNMVKYIGKNNLSNNSEVMSFLYGQIGHFVLEKVFKSYIDSYNENGNDKSIKKSLDLYLLQNCCSVSDKKMICDALNEKIVNNDVKKMIKQVYCETYGLHNLSFHYHFGRSVLRTLKNGSILMRNNIVKTKDCLNIKCSGFASENGYRSYVNCEELLALATDTSLDVIYACNDYLFDREEEKSFEYAFEDALDIIKSPYLTYHR